MQLVICIMSIQQAVNEFFPEARLIASGFYGSVYALSNTTVVKAVEDALFFEVEKNKYDVADKLAAVWANSINNLVVEFMDHIHIKDVQDDESIGHLFMMERIFPCVPTAFTIEELFAAIDVAEAQLKQLWKSGWAHCDLKRPDFVKKAYNETKDDILFNNIALTEVDGKCVIRLIDVGNANLEQYDEEDEIQEHIAKDQADWEEFKLWLLDYPRQH
jgi:hypothetical protein